LQSDRSLIGITFITALVGLAALGTIIGIVREQVWARWLAIAIYGLVGLGSVNVFIQSIGALISRNAYRGTEAIMLLRSTDYSSALTRICMVGIGITLILQKPENQGD
jgi:hypothetical protein